MQRQLEHLRTRYPEAKIISEVGSGLNFKRKKFLAILERIIDKATSQAIQFKVGNFKNGTWYSRTTKGLGFTTIGQTIPYQCEYGTELVYRRGKWFGFFPQYKETVPTGSDRVIALDPGNRTFLTGKV